MSSVKNRSWRFQPSLHLCGYVIVTQVIGNQFACGWVAAIPESWNHYLQSSLMSSHKQKVESGSDSSALLLLLFPPKKRKATRQVWPQPSLATLKPHPPPFLHLCHEPLASPRLHSLPTSTAAFGPPHALHPLALLHSLHTTAPPPSPLGRTSLLVACL